MFILVSYDVVGGSILLDGGRGSHSPTSHLNVSTFLVAWNMNDWL